MARRRRGAASDVPDLVAMLPWWGGIGLALASHVMLDRLSVPSATPMQAGQMDAFVQQALIAGFASVGRWLVPLLCLLGATVSFARRHRRRTLVGTVTGSDAASALDGMTWRESELLVGESFRRRGWQVTAQGGARASMPSIECVPARSAPMHAGPALNGDVVSPACPTCEAAMVRRMARTGVRAGSSFRGCPRFPTCRGTR